MGTRADRVRKWRQSIKRRIVDSMGGKCVCCGYNRCLRALDLHHISGKEHGIGSMLANPTKWHSIVKELRKCVLVCNRCHAEVHDGIAKIPTNATVFDEKFATAFDRRNNCPICGKSKPKYKVTCSVKCAGKKSWRVEWDKIDLKAKLKTSSFSQIGKELGVTDMAVRKRAKRLGLC